MEGSSNTMYTVRQADQAGQVIKGLRDSDGLVIPNLIIPKVLSAIFIADKSFSIIIHHHAVIYMSRPPALRCQLLLTASPASA